MSPTTEVSPVGIRRKGREKVGFITGDLASPGAVSLAGDLADILNISFYLPGTEFTPAITQNKGTDDRVGSKQSFESLGTKMWAIPDIQYIEDPQGVGTGTAKGVLLEDTDGFIVVRFGIDATVDWAAAQRVYAYPVTLGARWIIGTTTDEFALYAYQQVVATTGLALEDVVVAA